ncbi:MAG TPA: hypothetical protein VK400_12995 [Pyrinomonadaceae bacterium]|nr:hypothetical protein [Pyrinomonadaceae bacterium]
MSCLKTSGRLSNLILSIIILLLTTNGAFSQQETKRGDLTGKPVIWKPVNIGQRDLYLGPGGKAMAPNLRRVTFIRKETGGNNLKYRIKDASGKVWVAKIADESQPETVAVRLLWAVGYETEVNYLVPQLTIPGKGTFKNARLEARPSNIKREERWNWRDNPFAETKELQGLKIMMALINNWDLKDGNNIILRDNREQRYVVSDLGSAFGKLAPLGVPILNRFGRSVNRPDHYVKSEFVKGIEEDGHIDFAYKAKAKGLFDDITPDQGAWIANLLSQLSDKQIRDAFRAANYRQAEITMMSRAVRNRINELKKLTQPYEAKR